MISEADHNNNSNHPSVESGKPTRKSRAKIQSPITESHQFTNGNMCEARIERDSYGGAHLVGEKCSYTWKKGDVKYEGPVDTLQGQTPSTKGGLKWSDGSQYSGQLANGYRHGDGQFISKDGTHTYEGQWVMGRKHGKGTLRKWTVDDEGTRTVVATYEGDWENGLKHGKGKLRIGNTVYDGEFKSGVIDGKGKMEWTKDGKTIEVYTGEWKMGLQHGRGVHIWYSPGAAGRHVMMMMNRYDGEWRDGKRQGRGTFYYGDGSIYTGGWDNNKKHGDGVMQDKDGHIYRCSFEADKCISEVSIVWNDEKVSSQYVNYFKSGYHFKDLLQTLSIEDEGGMSYEDIKRDVLDTLLRYEKGLKELYRRCIKRRGKCIWEDSTVLVSIDLWKLWRSWDVLEDVGIASINRLITNIPRMSAANSREKCSRHVRGNEHLDDEPYDAVVIGAMSKVLVKGLDNLVPIQEDESGPRIIDIHAPDRPFLPRDFINAVARIGSIWGVDGLDERIRSLCEVDCDDNDDDPWECYVREYEVLMAVDGELREIFTTLARRGGGMRTVGEMNGVKDETCSLSTVLRELTTSNLIASDSKEQEFVESRTMVNPPESSKEEEMNWFLDESPMEIRRIVMEAVSKAEWDTLEASSLCCCDLEITFAEFQRLIIRMVEKLVAHQENVAAHYESHSAISSCLRSYVVDILLPVLIGGRRYKDVAEKKEIIDSCPVEGDSAVEKNEGEAADDDDVGDSSSDEEGPEPNANFPIWLGHLNQRSEFLPTLVLTTAVL